jgi:hypothetical protein
LKNPAGFSPALAGFSIRLQAQIGLLAGLKKHALQAYCTAIITRINKGFGLQFSKHHKPKRITESIPPFKR